MSNNSQEGNRSVIGYLILIGGGLFAAWYILKFIFYILSYVALNFFLALDLSAFGKISENQWMGYALLGLGLGAAGGAIAAQQRFRLNKLISAGAVLMALALSSFVFVSAPDSAVFSAQEETETTVATEAPKEVNKPKRHHKTAGRKTKQKVEPSVEEENQAVSIEEPEKTESAAAGEMTNAPEASETEVDENTSEVVNETSVLNEMEAYFTALNSDDFSAENYFATDVKKFINKNNVTPSKINDLHQEYRSEFVNGSSRIQKNTIYKMDQIDGLSYYQFWVDFDCYRKSKKKKQTCEVLVEVGLDEQGKIASFQETRVKGLRFFKE